MKKWIIGIMTAALAASITVSAQAATVSHFTDVSPSAWYYRAVEYAAAEGLFAGMNAHSFSPDMSMTRGMFVTVLGRKNGVDKSKYTTSRFSDVKPSDWFGPYVEWAAENSIVHGVGDGKFDPNRKISREQMAKILYGYAQLTGADTTVNETRYDQFPDAGRVSSYAVQSMKWAVTHGILKGTDGKLDPQGTATRAQVAQVFLNAKDVLTEKKIAPKSEEKPAQESDVPRITLTPEQQAALAPEQDPQEVVRQVLAGTKARWDDTLNASNAYELRIMSFGDVLADEFTPAAEAPGSTSHAVFNALEYLNDTGADRFFINAGMWDSAPSMKLKLYYTIPAKQDSALMAQVRKLVEQKFPNATFTPDTIKTGAGWRGYMKADDELSLTENASRVAGQEIEHLQEWYSPEQTFNYWISEPEPGKFYFFF